ncbi:uncharacterized protein Z518_08646 [Rhinocladiella mackenziei CBS 650.93]|uniref:Mid2 domain-containing protein n=1 Tax=Rhinocladiella mackenziei CBS 650.93 TaxID=1442369 RepID=A0A0D2I9Y3_9EURO|nr:uncharacterized protein Z518_08646 [Rhinocladiella mackenziei CBS 650.93]KIX02704.1 hypothetical protein Z518_08646 [Rhinocladiella mackenziei CBS 650.93]
MRLLFLTPLLTFLAVAQELEFITPGPGGTAGDNSLNPTYVFGSTFTIQWTPIEQAISLVLYQQLPDVGFEYIFQNRDNISSYLWTVTTQRDLSQSRVFFFQIFIEGDTSPSATSHYFNITGGGSSGGSGAETTTLPPSSSSSPSNPTTSSTTASTATTAPDRLSSGTAAPPAATTSSTPGGNGGLSTGAKVGLGIGIPVAVAVGIGVGWFVFGCQKRWNNTLSASEPKPYGYGYPPPKPEDYNGSATTPGELHASSARPPVELPLS